MNWLPWQVYSVLVIRRQIPRYIRLTDKSAAGRYQCPLSLSVFYQPVSTLCAGRATATYSGPVLDALVRTDRVDPLSERTLDLNWRSPRYDIDSQLSAADACITFSDGGEWLVLMIFGLSIYQWNFLKLSILLLFNYFTFDRFVSYTTIMTTMTLATTTDATIIFAITEFLYTFVL